MIGALSQKQGQFRYGKYLGVVPSNNVKDAPFFTYELMGEKAKRYNQVIQNLITSENSVIIKTNYIYEWLCQALVQLQNGKKYIISNLKKYEEDINPQVFDTVITGTDIGFYLELVEVGEYDG